jgi:hypothetical protein
MKFKTYEEYVGKTKEHFSKNRELKIPVDYMILSEDMFNLFNGDIQFGANDSECECQSKCEKCSCENKHE